MNLFVCHKHWKTVFLRQLTVCIWGAPSQTEMEKVTETQTVQTLVLDSIFTVN